MKNRRILLGAIAMTLALSGCAASNDEPATAQVAPAEKKFSADEMVPDGNLERIDESEFPIPEITVDSLFSSKATDLLNAFDVRDRREKLQICSDVANVLATMSQTEMEVRSAAMEDYDWSTLQDLVGDCNRMASNIK